MAGSPKSRCQLIQLLLRTLWLKDHCLFNASSRGLSSIALVRTAEEMREQTLLSLCLLIRDTSFIRLETHIYYLIQLLFPSHLHIQSRKELELQHMNEGKGTTQFIAQINVKQPRNRHTYMGTRFVMTKTPFLTRLCPDSFESSLLSLILSLLSPVLANNLAKPVYQDSLWYFILDSQSKLSSSTIYI